MSDEQRLHPSSWLFTAAQAAKGFLIPFIVLLLASGGGNIQLWAAVFIIPATVGAIVRYVVFRYQLGDDELVVRDGVLTRTERHIPYARIQNIDLVQNPFHRMLDVAVVRVETASGERPEAVIRVLSLPAIDDMRARVFAGRGDQNRIADSANHPQAEILLKVPAVELAKLGIISNKGLVVVGAALGVIWQQGQWFDPEEVVGRLLESEDVSAVVASTPLAAGVIALVVLVLVAVLILRVLSIGWFLVQLSDFTLRRRGDDLRAEYGLFTRITRTIPTSRIQSLTTTESPLHRWFGRQSVELRTVGGGGDDVPAGLEGANPKARSQWLAPMIDASRVTDLLEAVLPEIELRDVSWQRLAGGAWARIFRRWLIAVSSGSIVAGALFGSWLAAVLVAVPASVLAFVHARLYARHAGFALLPRGVVFKSGWWDRTVKIVRYAKIQTVERGETPFDRRSGMASIRIDTAGAERIGYTIDIPYIDASVASAVSRRLNDEASRHAFRWS